MQTVEYGKYHINPDNKVHGANTGPTWVLSAPDGPHVGPMNVAIREVILRNVVQPAVLRKSYITKKRRKNLSGESEFCLRLRQTGMRAMSAGEYDR